MNDTNDENSLSAQVYYPLPGPLRQFIDFITLRRFRFTLAADYRLFIDYARLLLKGQHAMICDLCKKEFIADTPCDIVVRPNGEWQHTRTYPVIRFHDYPNPGGSGRVVKKQVS
jgi:hypothetical protein